MIVEKLKLPEWLKEIESNKPLMKNIESGRTSRTKKGKLFLMLLSDDPSLESMWNSLKKRDDDLWFLSFMHDVEMSLSRTRFCKHTKEQRKTRADKISKLSKALARELKASDFDTGIYNAMNIKTQTRLSKNIPRNESGFFNEPYELLEGQTAFLWVSDFLEEVSEMAQNKSSDPDIVQVSETMNATQTYYIRHLTKCMRNRFNSPMRVVVSISASIIFKNHKITVPYVANMAP